MELNDWKTDEKKELEGVWIKTSPTAKVRIARMNNPRFRAAIERLMKDWKLVDRAGKMPELEQSAITIEAMAEAILLDWEGVTENGEPLPYSKETAQRALLESKDFLNFVSRHSMEMENFRIDVEGDEAGN